MESKNILKQAENAKISTSNEKKRAVSAHSSPVKVQHRKDRLTSVQKYEQEWLKLSKLSEDPFLDQLRQLAVNGELKVSKFRSICWALLLGVLNGRSISWATQRRCHRNRYAELKKQFQVNPRTTTEDDPLSQSEESEWNKHFCDKELCTVIKQDVIRTFPGVEYFRKPLIQNIMINILFCYARVKPEMCYRQGMHEILAPILFVMHSDHQALLHIQDISGNDVEGSLKAVLDPKYLEEDTYFIFSKIMTEIEPFYRINDLHPTRSGYFPLLKQSHSTKDITDKSELEVVAQLNFIRDTLLAREDPTLHTHLVKLDIPLPLFGIRWLRLLFGREFQLMDLLMLWDALFAEGEHFELTHYVVVAMLTSIKDDLIHSDYTTSLTYLMKYPTNIDIMNIIRHALHMISPERYASPPGLPIKKEPKQAITVDPYNPRLPYPIKNDHQQVISKIHASNEKASTLPRNAHSTNGKSPSDQNRDLKKTTGSSHTGQGGIDTTFRPRSGSFNSAVMAMAVNEGIQGRISSIQSSSARSAVRIASQQQPGQDPGIVDGYLENSPEVLKLQLHNAHTIMAISRLKLKQYLAVFRKHIPGDSMHELHQTMDGIEELSELLKTGHTMPYSMPVPVEPALEADEAATEAMLSKSHDTNHQPRALSPQVVTIPSDTILQTTPSRKSYLTQAEAKREFVRSLQSENSSLEVRAGDAGIILNSNNMHSHSQPSTSAVSSAIGTPTRKSRYEIPDDYITRTAARILSNRKELEMHEFIAAKLNKVSNNINIQAERDDSTQLPIVDPSGERQSPPNDIY